MKRLILLLILLPSIFLSFGQGLHVKGAYMSMKGGVHLVVDRQAFDGITRTSGGIINLDNNENNYLDWIVKNGGINDYIIPWISTDLTYIPFTFHVGTTGSNDGRLLFSTWRTNALNTAIGITGYPSSVTNMNSVFTGLDNSYYCTDRFWWIKYSGYTTPPIGTMAFYYVAPIELQAPNTIASESNLQVQYWDGAGWVLPPTGTDNTTNHYVSGVSTKSFDAPWVLVSNSSPLPVSLLFFTATCDDNKVKLDWATVSEINNDYFILKKSEDAMQWSVVTTISGAGNSNQTLYYTYVDDGTNTVVYYQLSQTDFDGATTIFPPIPVQCTTTNSFSVYPNPVFDVLHITAGDVNIAEIQISDMRGRLVYSGKDKLINMSTYSAGVYSLEIITDLGHIFTSKIIKK